MPLTDIRVRNAKPEPGKKTTRLYDQRGLYLEVSPSGGKWWRLKYRFVGKERRISLGVYPETSLKEAREDCDQARALLKRGVDPSQRRKREKLAQAEESASCFESITRNGFDRNRACGTKATACVSCAVLKGISFPGSGPGRSEKSLHPNC